MSATISILSHGLMGGAESEYNLDFVLTTAAPPGNYVPPDAEDVRLGTAFGVGETGTLLPYPTLQTTTGLSDDIGRFIDALKASAAFAAFCGSGNPTSSVFRYWVDELEPMPDALCVVCPADDWMMVHMDLRNEVWDIDSKMALMFDKVCARQDSNETAFAAMEAEIDAVMADLMPDPALKMVSWKLTGDSPSRTRISETRRESVQFTVFVDAQI